MEKTEELRQNVPKKRYQLNGYSGDFLILSLPILLNKMMNFIKKML